MGKANFSDEFKRDAVAQITERGYPVAEVSQRLGVSQHSLYAWKRQLGRQVSGDASKDAEIRRPGLGDRHHLHPHLGGLRLFGCRDRSLFPPRGELVDAMPADLLCGAAGAAHGRMAAQAEAPGADPLGLGLAVHQHGLGGLHPRPQS